MKKRLYGIKVILKSTIKENEAYSCFEEIVVTVKAKTEKKAIEKAKKYVKGYCKDYINANGQMVQTKIDSISDAFEALNKKNGVREVYAKFYQRPEEKQ